MALRTVARGNPASSVTGVPPVRPDRERPRRGFLPFPRSETPKRNGGRRSHADVSPEGVGSQLADEGQSADKVAEFGSKTPLKRPAQPEELAPAHVFLASDADSSLSPARSSQ